MFGGDVRRRSQQKLSIFREAESAGASVVSVADLGGEASVGSAVSSSVVALFGGSMRGSAVQLYQLHSRGLLHVYSQPFDNLYPLPGEHHAFLPGALRSPAAFVDSTFSRGWQGPPEDPAFGKLMDGHAGLREAIRSARWEWKLGLGAFKYPWWVQVRSLGAGTHVAVAATGGGKDGMSYNVGFAALSAICRELMTMLAPMPAMPRPFLLPTSFAQVFEGVLGGAPIRASVPPPAAGVVDVGPMIHATLQPFGGAKLQVHPAIAPQKQQNARRAVMPPSAQHLPIVALLDLTLMGSAENALVLTPTHAFLRVDEGRVVFAWSDVRAVMPPESADDELRITLARLGEISLPTGGNAMALHALLQQLVQIP